MNRFRLHQWLIFSFILIFGNANSHGQVGTGSVRGSVYLADTKLPAEGTLIELSPPADKAFPKIDKETGEYVIDAKFGAQPLSAKVDSSGSFQIDGVRPGDYFVLTYRPAYVSQREYIYPGALSPEANPGQSLPAFVQKVHITSGKTARVSLLLERGGTIEGTVSFPDIHTPIPHIQTPEGDQTEVAVDVEIKTRDGNLWRAMGAAHTDANGRYRMDGLPPASYVIFSGPPRGLVGGSDEIMYCCNSVRGSSARVVDIRGTEIHSGLDIEIRTAGLHSVTGIAVTESGEPIRQGIVRLYPTDDRGVGRGTRTQADGTFSFDHVADEDYTVSVEADTQTELVGPTADRTGLIMRKLKPAFFPAHQDIHVSGQNPPAVILRVESAPH